jgi:peptidoglycan biosynthesis protein MviN/MurJ (putative lipid II flippase)
MAFSGALFPKVSSRHEQGDTTRHLLTKTLAYSGLVCGAGVLICFVFAREIISLVIKRADLTEQALNTMVPLLRYMGIAITPYGLACIVINYHLAKHWTKFLPYLVASTFLQIILLKIFHETFTQVLTVLFIAGILILLCGVPAAIMEKLKVKSQRAYR